MATEGWLFEESRDEFVILNLMHVFLPKGASAMNARGSRTPIPPGCTFVFGHNSVSGFCCVRPKFVCIIYSKRAPNHWFEHKVVRALCPPNTRPVTRARTVTPSLVKLYHSNSQQICDLQCTPPPPGPVNVTKFITQ